MRGTTAPVSREQGRLARPLHVVAVVRRALGPLAPIRAATKLRRRWGKLATVRPLESVNARTRRAATTALDRLGCRGGAARGRPRRGWLLRVRAHPGQRLAPGRRLQRTAAGAAAEAPHDDRPQLAALRAHPGAHALHGRRRHPPAVPDPLALPWKQPHRVPTGPREGPAVRARERRQGRCPERPHWQGQVASPAWRAGSIVTRLGG